VRRIGMAFPASGARPPARPGRVHLARKITCFVYRYWLNAARRARLTNREEKD
jgi:hypothetical protein